jgi:hypothetical protein
VGGPYGPVLGVHVQDQPQGHANVANAVVCGYEQELSKLELILAGRKRYRLDTDR